MSVAIPHFYEIASAMPRNDYSLIFLVFIRVNSWMKVKKIHLALRPLYSFQEKKEQDNHLKGVSGDMPLIILCGGDFYGRNTGRTLSAQY